MSDASDIIEYDDTDNKVSNETEESDNSKEGRCGLFPLTPKCLLLVATGAAVAAYVGYSIFSRF